MQFSETSPIDAKPSSAVPAPNSADRIIFWINCDQVIGLSDAELDLWHSRGVGGFVCMTGHLGGLGGTQDFTGDLTGLSAPNFDLQRALRDSNIVHRAATRGMKMYLGTYLVNYSNRFTPLADWFDDTAWSGLILPKIRGLAAGARSLGFAGLALDHELYPQDGGVSTATWDWTYPGNTRPEAEVRAKARQRGQQVMSAIVDGFPGVELMAYDVEFPETWEELVQGVVNNKPNAFAPRLDIDFWDGLTSVKGYGAIRLVNAIFYKSPHFGTWDTALQYDYNRLFSYLSRRISNWKYASSRLFLSPFSWIDPGPNPTTFDDANPPDYVHEQLLAFRRWGMGGEFPNYVYGDLRSFDYSPYVSALQEASAPAAIDAEPPALVVSNWSGRPGRAGRRRRAGLIQGTVHDNLAVRAIRWHDERGNSGVAQLTWRPLSGDFRSGFTWDTQWAFPVRDVPRRAIQLTIAAEDIKGNVTKRGACAKPKLGSNSSEKLKGTRKGDDLRGRGGRDRLLSGRGDDCLLGQGGRDLLRGGPGNDKLVGGLRSDRLISRDHTRDVVRCGPGRRDRAVVDRRDRLRGCEKVRRR